MIGRFSLSIKMTLMILYSSMLIISCQDPSQSNEDESIPSIPDSIGNLVIVNQLSEPLLLRHQGVFIKEIPANYENFLIEITTTSGNTSDLKLWIKDHVTDYDNPDESLLFRRWIVILSTTLEEENHTYWVISSLDSHEEAGSIYLNYPQLLDNGSQNPYNVDVFLNITTGSRIATLEPGTFDFLIGLDYGVYNLHYRYWYSVPYNPEGFIEIGWSQLPPDGLIILNSNNNTDSINILTYEESQIGRYGKINISNNLNEVVQIYANSIPIENYMAIENPEYSSLLPENSSYTYSIGIGNYWFEAKYLDDSTIEEISNIDIIDIQSWEFDGFNWIVDEINDNQNTISILFNNLSNSDFTLHKYFDNSYLGYYLNSNLSELYEFNLDFNAISIINNEGNFGAVLYPISAEWTINEDDLIPTESMDLIAKFNLSSVFELSDCGNEPLDTLSNQPYYVSTKIVINDVSITKSGISHWNWDFGDGNILSYGVFQSNVENVYNTEGNYILELVVMSDGEQDLFSQQLSIINKPLKLTSPNCNAVYQLGESIDINWQFNNNYLTGDEQLFIFLINGTNEILIATPYVNNENYLWEISIGQIDVSIENSIKIQTSNDSVDYVDLSDEYFTIIE